MPTTRQRYVTCIYIEAICFSWALQLDPIQMSSYNLFRFRGKTNMNKKDFTDSKIQKFEYLQFIPDIHFHFSSNHYRTYVWVNHFLLDLGIKEIQNFDRLVLKRLLHQQKFHNPLCPLCKDMLFHEKSNNLLRIHLLGIGSNPRQFQKGSRVQHNREALSLIPRF